MNTCKKAFHVLCYGKIRSVPPPCGVFSFSQEKGAVSKSMWKTLIRPAMIFIPLGLGVLFPGAGAYSFLIRYLLMIMLFMVFLKLDLRQLAFKRSHFLLFGANLLVGVGAYLIVRAAAGEGPLAQAAFFTGITPTATAAAVVMGFLGGSVGYVITAFVLTNVGMALLLPWLLGWICGNTSFSFILNVGENLFFLLVIPAAAAFVVRRIHPAAEKWPSRFATASFGLWSACLFIIAGSASANFRANPGISPWIIGETALIALVLCVLNFSAGYFLGEKGLRHEASQSLGQKNTTLTIYLALVYAGPLAAFGVISYVLWHNSYNAVQLFLADRAEARRRAAAEHEAERE